MAERSSSCIPLSQWGRAARKIFFSSLGKAIKWKRLKLGFQGQRPKRTVGQGLQSNPAEETALKCFLPQCLCGKDSIATRVRDLTPALK
jgi:hypothetical protein